MQLSGLTDAALPRMSSIHYYVVMKDMDGCKKFCCRKDCRLSVLWYVKFHQSIHHLQFITNQCHTLSVQSEEARMRPGQATSYHVIFLLLT